MEDEGVTWSGVMLRRRGAARSEARAGRVGPDGPTPRVSTRFQAGSVSKTVVAVTALRLVESGVLDLHVPISRWLGDDPAWLRDVTLHRLLTHTAGLGHWSDMPHWDMADPPPREEVLAAVLAAPLPHRAGTFSYSNFGFLLAAMVIERTTGGSYADAARSAVLDPAGMTATTSGVFPVGEPDCAVGRQDGEWLRISSTPTSIPGTGDLWTTVEDVIRLSRALRQGLLLGPRLTRAARSVQVPLPSPTVLADDRIIGYGYGYGVWIGRLRDEPAVIMPGDNVGYRSLVVQVDGADLDIAILTNDDGPSLRRPLDLALTPSGTAARSGGSGEPPAASAR